MVVFMLQIDKHKIEILQARSGMSRSEMAKRLGIKKQTLANMLHRKSCSPDKAGEIAKLFDVDVTEILSQ